MNENAALSYYETGLLAIGQISRAIPTALKLDGNEGSPMVDDCQPMVVEGKKYQC